MRRLFALSPVLLSALVSACAADVSSESIGAQSSAILPPGGGVPVCTVHTPPGTKCTNPPAPPLPVVEYETAAVSDVSVTVGFLTPRGPTATSVTINFPSVTPASPTDGIAVATDAAGTSHALPINGLVASTSYRYDIWVGSTREYTGYFATSAPVAISLLGPGSHDATIGPVVTQSVAAQFPANNAVGFVIGVRRGAVEDLYYYGTTDLIQGPTTYAGTSIAITGGPMNASTVFGIGSISKTITATLLARYSTDPSLAGAQVHMGDSLMSYVPPAYKVNGWQSLITLFELGHYTSGLERDPTTPVNDTADLFTYLETAPEMYVPGMGTGYSNLGFDLLGRALENKIGTSWEGLVQDNIAGPLGMVDTKTLVGGNPNCGGVSPCNYLISVAEQSRMAQGYGCSTEPCTPGGLPGPTGANTINPAGGLLSTGTDMLKWLSANMGHTSAGWMGAVVPTVRTIAPPGAGLGWGVGSLTTASAGPTMMVEKSGDLPGSFQAYIAYLPQLDTGAFVMSNSDLFDTAKLVQAILTGLPPSNLVNLPAY